MDFEDELRDVVAEVAAEHGVPGVSVGVLDGDRPHVVTHGVTNAEHPLPVTPGTLSQVASITKTFTGAAMALLVEQGDVAFEDPVARHLPDLAPSTGLPFDEITVEHVLSHQGGFDGDHLFVGRTDDLGALADARRLFPPGNGFSYSNAGFSIAGAVIEAVSGQPFDRFVHDRLLVPLGMDTATFHADDAITHSVLAPHWVFEGAAYVIRAGGWQPGWEMGPTDRAAAGLVASVEHLLAWCWFQRSGTDADGNRLLSEESLERLHTPVVTADRWESIGLDWHVGDIEGITTIGHGGVTVGYLSDLVIVPDHDLAVIGLNNATNGGIVNQRIRRWVLEQRAALVERDPEPDPAVHIDRSRYQGRYLHPFADLTVTDGDEPGTVVVTPVLREDVPDGWRPPTDPPTTCGFVAEDAIVTLDNLGTVRTATFGFGSGATADWLLWQGRRALRAGRDRHDARGPVTQASGTVRPVENRDSLPVANPPLSRPDRL